MRRRRILTGLLPALAAELVRLRVDVIVAAGDGPIEAARRATSTIPIVMAVSTDALERGFIASLARPGGNITGVTAFVPELAGKRIELLRDIVPKARRIGVVSAATAFHRSELGRIQSAARPAPLGRARTRGGVVNYFSPAIQARP